jgi:hypothetical protein
VPAKIVANKIVYVMRALEKRRVIRWAGIKDGACIWVGLVPDLDFAPMASI